MEHNELEILARGLVLRHRDGERVVLLCRSLKGGYCYLPGGHVEFDEAAAEALRREFQEEAGLSAEPGDLALVSEERFDQRGRRRHEYTLVFHVEHLAGEDRTVPTTERPPLTVESREDAIGFEWVALRQLREVDLRPASITDWLEGNDFTAVHWQGS